MFLLEGTWKNAIASLYFFPGTAGGCFFHYLYHLNKKYKKPICHDVIGGILASKVESKKNWKKYLNSFSVNWVELPSLKEKLQGLGKVNVMSLTNFKRLNICSLETIGGRLRTIQVLYIKSGN